MKRGRSWFWGIFFILATVVLIVSQVVSFATIGVWSMLALILLVAVIIGSAMHRVWGGIFVPVALIYLVLQKPLMWPEISAWVLIVAAILLSVGLHFLIRPKPARHCGEEYNFQADEGSSSEDYPVINVKFGNVVRYLHSDCLKGGQITARFGAVEVYFDNVSLAPEGAALVLDCSFGGIVLYVPRNWPVEDLIGKSIAGVDFKNKHMGQPDMSLPKLKLTGNANVSGVEVVYI